MVHSSTLWRSIIRVLERQRSRQISTPCLQISRPRQRLVRSQRFLLFTSLTSNLKISALPPLSSIVVLLLVQSSPFPWSILADPSEPSLSHVRAQGPFQTDRSSS